MMRRRVHAEGWYYFLLEVQSVISIFRSFPLPLLLDTLMDKLNVFPRLPSIAKDNAMPRGDSSCSDSEGTNGNCTSTSQTQQHSSSSSSTSSSSSGGAGRGRSSSCSRSSSPGRPENTTSLIEHLQDFVKDKGTISLLRRGNNGVVLSYVPRNNVENAHSQNNEPSSSPEAAGCSERHDCPWNEPLALKISYAKSVHTRNELEVLRSVLRASKDGTMPRSELLALPSLRVTWPSLQDLTRLRNGDKEVPARRGNADTELIGLEKLGPDLFELTGRFRFSEQEIAECGRHMLAALRTLHRLGFVHKSVKPENFCFRCARNDAAVDVHNAWITLIDFGRAVRVKPSSDRYEEPFTGWWYSVNGFLGRPQGKADDLYSLVVSIGYLLADALPRSSVQPPSANECKSTLIGLTGVGPQQYAVRDAGELFLDWRHREQKQCAKLRREVRRSLPRGTPDRVIADAAFAVLKRRGGGTHIESNDCVGMHKEVHRRDGDSLPSSSHEDVLRWIGLPRWWCSLFDLVHNHVLLSPSANDESSVAALAQSIASGLTSAVVGRLVQPKNSTGGDAPSAAADLVRADTMTFDLHVRQEVDALVQKYVEERSAPEEPPVKRFKAELCVNH